MKISLERSIVVSLPALPREATALSLLWIAPGVFWMGSPEDKPERSDEEEQQTAVTLTHGFWLGKYEVTQAQWLAIMERNPSHFRDLSQYTLLFMCK